MSTMANSTDSGILIATTIVGLISFKNRASIIIARAAPRSILWNTL